MSRRTGLGFHKGYITLLKGDQSLYEDYLRASVARYNTIFGWYIASCDEIPSDLPSGLEPKEFKAEEFFVSPDSDDSLPTAQYTENINKLLYDESPSEFYGQIGYRYDFKLTLIKKINSNSAYGVQYFYIFQDESMNTFTWKTGARDLDEGTTYSFRATVKAHNIYKNQKQTELTRAMEFKVL